MSSLLREALRRHRAWVTAVCVAVLLALSPSTARAGDLEDFRAARSLYEAHDWTSAAAALEALVGGESPRLGIPALVTEARKYLAATYVFLGREESARAQFERLLREEPDYALDAAQFPREVVDLFEQVRTRLIELRAAEAQRTALETENERLREENARLHSQLSDELTVEVSRSQWLVQLPYGVGQFENGEEGLGAFFLVSEALLTATLVVTSSLQLFYANQVLGDPTITRDEERLPQYQAANAALEVVNFSAAGALLLLAGIGMVQANLAFQPTRSVRVPRSSQPTAVRLLMTPISLRFSVHF